ncbi:hypothetical protein [Marinomonas pollencensis]|uniref:Uncharacterized protein n=1 Tax=Marinomonas pollencensis TaxID=491954 RepID=A0A3E0DPY3_9GAMM|nr:hypothetical protein [Marinomonas pollencensis]REG84245.1 hypothetical protein DFP81_104124 [Marinomonas pollencensis]
MKYLLSTFMILTIFNGQAWANDESPNFELGLGGGLLNSKALFNLDVLLNIPLNEVYSTQVLLNSNYLMTGRSKDSFAQSELASNWFARNEYGRLGVGVGVSELKPKDDNKETDRSLVGRVMADAFWDEVTFSGNYTSYDSTLNNLSSTRLGASYYLTEDVRISAYRERYNDESAWRIEAFFQPDKYRQLASVGVIARSGEDNDYLGVIARYYFDTKVSLQERERRYH